MKVQFIANACFRIELADGRSIITDPWLTGGAYYGSWYNYPPVPDDLRDEVLSSRPTWIYVSHLHPDHLDPDALRAFPSDTPILIGALPHQHLRRSLQAAGLTNIVELPRDEPQQFNGVEVTVLPQFAAAGDGFQDEVDYAMDTSLAVRDTDGSLLVHLVDNALGPADAVRVRDRFGSPTVAIAPYAGASLYPHAFAYPDDEKDRRTTELRQRTTADFVEIVRALAPKYAIPAAGSYVMGGRLAEWSRWLHQATPAQIDTAWSAAPPASTELCQLTPGDVLDTDQGTIERASSAEEFLHFSQDARLAHARSLADRPIAHDLVRVPDEFRVPWPRLLATGRANLWHVQEQRKLFPAIDVAIRIRSTDGVASAPPSFEFSLDSMTPSHAADRPRVTFTIDAALLLMVLVGAAIWNNVEIGALVEVDRVPDVYEPTVHSLMSYFTLLR